MIKIYKEPRKIDLSVVPINKVQITHAQSCLVASDVGCDTICRIEDHKLPIGTDVGAVLDITGVFHSHVCRVEELEDGVRIFFNHPCSPRPSEDDLTFVSNFINIKE